MQQHTSAHSSRKRQTKEFKWSKVTKGTKQTVSHKKASPVTTSNSFHALTPKLTDRCIRFEIKAHANRPANMCAHNRIVTNIAAKKRLACPQMRNLVRIAQLKKEKERCDKEEASTRREEDKVLLANATTTQPPASDAPKGATKAQRLLQHLQRNKEEPKHSARWCSLTRADIQRAQYLSSNNTAVSARSSRS